MKYYIIIVLIIMSSCSEDENSAPLPAPLLGCTNQNAVNYDAGATQDDGSCVLAPQHIPGVQLGDFYQGGTVFYLDGAGGGMVFKDTWGNPGGPCSWSLNYNSYISTSTSFGDGYNNTALIFNQSNSFGDASGPEYFWHDCFGFFPSSGWHIPSIEEVRELYMYGSAPYYASINHPGAIRGWGYGYSIAFGDETYTTYGNEYPSNYPYKNNPTIVSSSEASNSTFYSMKFEDNWNGLYNESPKYQGIPVLYSTILGVKSF